MEEPPLLATGEKTSAGEEDRRKKSRGWIFLITLRRRSPFAKAPKLYPENSFLQRLKNTILRAWPLRKQKAERNDTDTGPLLSEK
jgi:hypothetical protein